MLKIDKTDRQILSILKLNARISNAELAKRVNLSPTPCLRRIKRLENEGYILGYRAVIDPHAGQSSVGALVSIKLAQNSLVSAEEFELAMQQLEPVTQCVTVSGSYDYVLTVKLGTLTDLEQFLKKDLGRISAIQEMASTIILNEVKG